MYTLFYYKMFILQLRQQKPTCHDTALKLHSLQDEFVIYLPKSACQVFKCCSKQDIQCTNHLTILKTKPRQPFKKQRIRHVVQEQRSCTVVLHQRTCLFQSDFWRYISPNYNNNAQICSSQCSNISSQEKDTKLQPIRFIMRLIIIITNCKIEQGQCR